MDVLQAVCEEGDRPSSELAPAESKADAVPVVGVFRALGFIGFGRVLVKGSFWGPKSLPILFCGVLV